MNSNQVAPVSFPLAAAISFCALAGTTALWWFGYAAGIAPFPPLDLADLIIRESPGSLATWAISNLRFWARILVQVAGVAAVPLAAVLIANYLRRHPGPGAAIRPAIIGAIICSFIAVTIQTSSGWSAVLWLPAWFGLTIAGPLALAGVWIERLRIAAADNHPGDDAWAAASFQHTRRTVLRNAAASAIVLGLFGWVGGLVARSAGLGPTETADNVPLDERMAELEAEATEQPPLPTAAPADDLPDQFVAPEGVRPRVTANEDFYVIDISTRKPAISDRQWTLKVHGMVREPIEITYLDLLAMPAVEQWGTLMCISYFHDSGLISSTRWTGVPLRDLLQRTGILDGAVDLVLKGAGGYSDSIPVAKALERETLLVYGMNGATLPQEHGYPCRLYVPNIYGEKNVKWLEEIEVVDYDYQGYWQERGWSDDAVINIISEIDTPRDDLSPDERGIILVGGIAFAGSRGIDKVELQIDDREWVEAEVEPYDPLLLWQRWKYEWDAEPGKHRLTVRATDGMGNLQESSVRDPYPDGATGLHSVTLDVVQG